MNQHNKNLPQNDEYDRNPINCNTPYKTLLTKLSLVTLSHSQQFGNMSSHVWNGNHVTRNVTTNNGGTLSGGKVIDNFLKGKAQRIVLFALILIHDSYESMNEGC